MSYEIIDAPKLAERWDVPESWIRAGTRERTSKKNQIPHLRFGRYVRFEWGCPALENWLAAHRSGNGNGGGRA